MTVRVGMEASGHARCFERLLRDWEFELWLGDGLRFAQAGAEAEDQSSGCAAPVATDDGRPLSADLGARHSESGHAATAVASAWPGADAHAGDESVSCRGANEALRRKKALWRPAGRNKLESLKLAPWASRRPKSSSTYWITDAEDTGCDAATGTGSEEATGDAAADDASRSRSADGAGL